MNRFIVTFNPFNKKDYNTMFTTRQDTCFKKPDKHEDLIDMSIHVGSVMPKLSASKSERISLQMHGPIHPAKTSKPDGKHGSFSGIAKTGLFRRLGRAVGKRANREGGRPGRGLVSASGAENGQK